MFGRSAVAILVGGVFCGLPAPDAHAQTPAENDSAAAAAAETSTLPLIPTRTLHFSTDEGTWISLDVAPDGERIAFELLGDLYELPITGGAAVRLTSGQAYDMQPRYSPDGSRLVFVSDRDGAENLWIADADGENAWPLTSEERTRFMSPIWTADGRYIIAIKDSHLWLYHVDGGSGVQISDQVPGDSALSRSYFGPALGPEEDLLWVNVRGEFGGGVPTGVRAGLGQRTSRDHGPRSSVRLIGSQQLAELDLTSGRLRVRTHELEGAFRPVPSPDGRWVVYATRFDERPALKLLDLTSGEDRWLRMDVQRDDHQGGGPRGDRDVYPGSAFTPDSRALITSYDGKIWRIDVPSGDAEEIPFMAEVEQELGPLVKFEYPINDSVLTVSQIRGGRPSPDGQQIAFTAMDQLWVAPLPSAMTAGADTLTTIIEDARRLTSATDVEHAPAWAPDGRHIAYATWNDSIGGHIYRVPVEGEAQPERLTRVAAFFDGVNYSRDGSKILAIRGSKMHRMRMLEDFGRHSSTAELEYVWLPASGGEAERIMWVGVGATQQGRNQPHAGPEADRLYVWAGSEGLLSMRYDGTDVRTVLKVTAPLPGRTGSPPVPDEVLISPDGTRALVRAHRNVYMVTVPPMGGEAASVAVGRSSILPTRRLSKIGGDFIGWGTDGAVAHYSIGRSFFVYDVARGDSIISQALEVRRQTGTEDAETGVSSSVYEGQRFDIAIHAAKDKPRGTVVLRGARLITMRGDEVIPAGDVVVQDNRIVALGPAGSVSIPEDAETVDVSGRTIIPGLVDIHAHTWVAWGVHRGQVSQFLAQLAYGVTTQRDPQTSSEDVLTYRDRMEVGDLIGPRLYFTGPGIFAADNIRSLDDARSVLRRYAEHFDTHTIKQYMAGDRKVRQWVAMAARELELTPTAEGGSYFTMNLTLMQDGYAGLQHALPISPFYRDVVELGRFSEITYTPTLIVSYGGPSGFHYYLTQADPHSEDRLQYFTPHDEIDKWKTTQWHRSDQYIFPLHAQQLKKWVEGGARAGLGSHGELQGLGTHWELWMMAAGGMAAHDALRVATLESADAIGLGGDIGSLDVGKLADLVVLEENPLESLEHTTSIEFVMKNGRLYDARNLTELWPEGRSLPTQWWWRLEPPGSAWSH